MRKPLIIITAGKRNEATARGEQQTVVSGCNVDYVNAVVGAGGAPLLLPSIADTDALRAAMEVADGVLLSGGGDVNALTYGEEPHLTSCYQDPIRDDMEFEVTRLALEANVPILGVCRGIQVLNVVMGGTLIQDIPSQVPGAVKHYAQPLDVTLLHTIEIEPDSLMARVTGATSMAVNSWHHQTVKDLGHGLRVNSRARDGVIEGVESSDGKPILGVQFHPEECVSLYPRFRVFFDWLVQEASAYARRSSDEEAEPLPSQPMEPLHRAFALRESA